ncbi:MAG: 6-phosphogluconolactonase [Nibricoccus sp.]
MTTVKKTDYGRVIVGTPEELFRTAVTLVAEAHGKPRTGPFDWALTGGSTPKEWYRWCVENRAIPEAVLKSTRFTVSDERCVPLHSDQSNFGTAERLLLSPLGVPVTQQHPWPVHLLPAEAADAYEKSRVGFTAKPRGYSVCFLGMGEDGHTASIFPKSPLLLDTSGRRFAAIEVPGKGWRLTVTPAGLSDSELIVIMALGASKAAMLGRVFKSPYNPSETPVQLVKSWRDRVIWLVDPVAAAGV